MRAIDATGVRYGRLVGVERVGVRQGNAVWRLRCDCGREVTAVLNGVRTGNVRSCGCLRSEASAARVRTHGMTRSRTYRIWRHMLNRCRMQQHPKWHRYGGRGIAVCEAWQRFEGFLADMGEAPAGLSIERVDNDRGYEPGNCRWATFDEQAANRSNTRRFEIDGRVQHLAAWARELGLTRDKFLRQHAAREVE